MARRVIWSLKAQQEREHILQYWINRNKSTSYSKILQDLFNQRIEIILDFPQIGSETNRSDIRFIVVRKYLLFYHVFDDTIVIISIWDGRQNPSKKPFISK